LYLKVKAFIKTNFGAEKMCEVLANVIRSIDVFGPPAASQFTFKTKTHHSTVCGGIFGIALISLSAWFFALECRNLSS